MKSKSQDKPYLKFIAYLQIIGIIFVVLGHSFHEHPDGLFGHTSLVYRMMSSFRMPLFLFVSGFLMVFTMQMRGERALTPGAFFNNKAKRLLIPFVVLSAVTYLPRASLSGMADDVIEISFWRFVRSFVFTEDLVIGYFWFIQANFLLLVVCYALLYWGIRNRLLSRYLYGGLVLIFVGLQFLPLPHIEFWSIWAVLHFGIYFVLGACYCGYSSVLDRYLPWDSISFFVLSVVVWGYCFFLMENTGFAPLCSLAGIMMCISFAKVLEVRGFDFLDHLIGTNYMIFLLSWYANVLCQQVTRHFVELPWWVYSIMSLVAGVYVPVLCYKLLQKHHGHKVARSAAFLLGQSFKAHAR